MRNLRIIICLFLVSCFFRIPVQAQDFPNGPFIRISDGNPSILPAAWLGGKIKARITGADTARLEKDTLRILHGLYKYPVSVLEKNLASIYLTGKLFFNGQRFTGTNSTDAVFIAATDNPEIEKTFHHEFSSILLRKMADPFFEMKWRAVSPDLRRGNSASAVKAGLSSVAYDSLLLTRGYLSPYSLSNWENDFNMYAENLFAGGKIFWSAVDRYPPVRTKTNLILQFYKDIWGGFTESFFRGLAEQDEKDAANGN